MASKIKGINIKIGADTTGLDTALKGIESAGKKATSELREVNSSLRNNNDSVVLWKQKQELLTTALEESRKKLDFLRESQEQIKQLFENKEIDDGQYRAFQRELENTQRQTNSLEEELKQANQRVEELGNGLEQSGEQAENSANGGYTVLGNVFANLITKGIELAWTALKNFTQDVVATGAEYESAISNVAAISGAMSEEVEMLQAKAEEMGATTKFTAAESAEAMGYMAMAGWKVNDMVSGLDGIMDLSAASGENLASVSDIVTDALTAFGLTAGDSAHFADVLAAASSNANTNVAMMGETFKYAAPIAGALGFSIEDTAEAIGLMANSGIKASQAGTSLRTILTNMSHDITIFGDAFKSAENAEGKYIVTTTNADGSMRDLSEILSELREGWNKLTEAEQAANAANETIAGKNAMSGFLALMNSAPADIEKLSTAIENADGAAQGMASTMLDNLQGDRTLFESAFDGVKIAISKELNPALRDLVQYATSQIPKIQKTVEPVANFAIKAVGNVPRLVDGLQKIKPLVSGIGTTVLGIFAGIKAAQIAKSIKTSLIPAVTSLWTVVAAHPIGAIISATAIAATAITKGIYSYLDAQLEVKSEGELLIEQHNEEIQAMLDKKKAIEDLNNSFYENVDGIQNQTDRTKDLWKELDKLADQYGNVQQKDKIRAEYILNELNEALGTEYTMTGNQIDNYRTLSAEIDNVIAKKQAEMMLDAYLANSTEMTKQRIEARTAYENAYKDYQTKNANFEKAKEEYERVSGDNWENLTREVDQTKAFNQIDADAYLLYKNPEEYKEAAKNLWTAYSEERQARSLRKEAEKNYQATSEYFENLEQIQEAYSLGQYDLMSEIIYAEKDLTSTTLDESATDAEKRLQIYSESLQKTLSDFELAVKDMKQKSVDEMEKELSDTMQTALQAGVDPAEVWAKFEDGFYKLQANGLDISPLITPLIDSGMKPAQAFDDWQEVFRTQLKNGGDMSAMLEWMNNSGYYNSISSVFGSNENFIKYLKEQSRKGLDISETLELGAKSGLAESEEFVKIFKSQVSKNLAEEWDVGNLLELGSQWGIDLGEEFGESFSKQMVTLNNNGVDLITFIKWAESNGKSVAEVFGENFQAELSEYLKNKFKNFTESNSLFSSLYGNKTLSERLIKQFASGKNVSELVKQAEKQGLKVGDVFGDNYTDVIQQQIDKGYSIDELLEWGEESGLSTADMFGNRYTPEVQRFIDKGFSVDSLLSWARNSGLEAGKLFGENFQNYANMYIADKRAELERAMNSSNSFISDRVSSIFGNLPFMADGGFLHSGQAIVAEAGPELLEVMNGGVKVTPLTRSAQNTPVSDGGQKIFYSNYTINATISGGYDVRRLAENLDNEKRKLEMGVGL